MMAQHQRKTSESTCPHVFSIHVLEVVNTDPYKVEPLNDSEVGEQNFNFTLVHGTYHMYHVSVFVAISILIAAK